MTIELLIQDDTSVPAGVGDALAAAAEALLIYLVIPSVDLSIMLADDDYLRDLNYRFRGVDKTTDVLSFPASEDLADLQSVLPYLGDIAISVPNAQRQAAARGHSETAELQLLTIHGILHLLGYDHLDADEKETMWAIQRTVLSKLGLEGVIPTEE